MKQYVLGFLIDRTRGEVVVVRKNRPAWQSGKYNGVGGKVEVGETLAEAMQREFLEETGHEREDWERYCVLIGHGFQVHVFCAFDSNLDAKVAQTTDEVIAVRPTWWFDHTNAITNLEWLIPMAMSIKYDRAREFVISEQY